MLQHNQIDLAAEAAPALRRGPLVGSIVALALAVLVALALTLSVLLPRLAVDVVAPTSSAGSLAADAAALLAGDGGVVEPEARGCWLFCWR